MGKTLRTNTGRSPDYRDGYQRAVKDCITWLHERAAVMKDPHATQVLNSVAFWLSVDNSERENGDV